MGIDRSLPGDPMVLGTSGAVYLGSFGLRASGGAVMGNVQLREVSPAFDGGDGLLAFSGDLDLVLQGGRRAGAGGSFGNADPRVFAGIGVRGDRFTGQGLDTHTVVSFGSTLSYSLLSRIRAEAEVRRVIPLEQATDIIDGSGLDQTGAWEYRIGFSLNFGRGALRPRPGILDVLPIPGAAPAGSARRVVDVAPGTVLETADDYLGVPYVWGGADPSGFDCSGFVQYVFAQHDVRLPRPSRVMATVGDEVHSVNQLQPGDLMFFDGAGDGQVDHVAMYAGNQMIVHASSSGRYVGYDDLTTSRGAFFRRIFVGGRRVLGVEIAGVTVHAAEPAVAAGDGRRRGRPEAGISAFFGAAGVASGDLVDLARELYGADEVVDPPDRAPARRW